MVGGALVVRWCGGYWVVICWWAWVAVLCWHVGRCHGVSGACSGAALVQGLCVQCIHVAQVVVCLAAPCAVSAGAMLG